MRMRPWSRWEELYRTVAQFIYFVAISGIAVNYVLFNSIVLNSILTACNFGNVPNSDIYFGNALITDNHQNFYFATNTDIP